MSKFSKHDSQVEETMEVGTAEDVEKLMRKYDRESNTRIWEGKPALIIRGVMVLFSLYCIYSTLFSVAALEKRLTAFLALVVVMGYLTYPASKHHVRHNFIPWYDFVFMIIGAACFMYYCISYDALVKVLTSASKMTWFQVTVGVVGLLCIMELCRRCVGIPILCVAGVLLIYTFSTGIGMKRVLYTLFFTTSGIMGTPVQVCAKYIVVFIISAPSLNAPASPPSLLTWPTPWWDASPAARPKWPLSPPPCAAWSPVPPWATPLPPVP